LAPARRSIYVAVAMCQYCLYTGAQSAVNSADQPTGWFRQHQRTSWGRDRERDQLALAAAEGRRRLPEPQEQIRQGTPRQDRGARRDEVSIRTCSSRILEVQVDAFVLQTASATFRRRRMNHRISVLTANEHFMPPLISSVVEVENSPESVAVPVVIQQMVERNVLW